jgi:hypothetical protein
MVKTGYSAVKQVVAPYWYKIGGKSVSKAKYNAYNNPVGDGPTKSTNDPDASGNKAKIEKSRSNNKASKRPTVLTKKQTELKNQGTKITKKPPLKQKVNGKKLPKGYTNKDAKFLKEQREDVVRYEDLDKKGQAIWKKQGKPVPKKKSPLQFDWKNALDNVQTGLVGAGMVPAWGNVADGINTAISAGRAGYSKYKGDEAGYKKHRNNAAINATMMIPGVGQGAAATRLAGKGLRKGSKILAENIVKKAPKVIAKRAAQTTAKKVQSEVDKATTKVKDNKNKRTITINSKSKSNKNLA